MDNNSQVQMNIRCMKTIISEALVARLELVRGLKYISFDKIKLMQSDFADHEIPAVQVIDVAETVQHEQARTKNTWQLTLEIIDKSTENRSVGQVDMWNMEYQIKRALWADPTLGIKGQGFQHIRMIGSSTDLHILEPFYFARLDFEALYYEHIVRDC
jgi:hypothetical protein